MKRAAGLAAVLVWTGCGTAPKPAATKPPEPAKVTGATRETDLATVTLAPQAEERLGIRTAAVESGEGSTNRTFAGEVALPPGQVVTLTAPVAGTLAADATPPSPGAQIAKGRLLFRLAPLLPLPRDLRSGVEAEVAAAQTRLETARARTARSERMLRDQVGTAKAQEEAAQDLQLAQTALAAAQAKLDQIRRAPLDADVAIPLAAPQDGILRQVHARPGQTVAAGAALAEIAAVGTVWIRVPVYAGEIPALAPDAAAQVQALGGGPARTARPVAAPPTADPAGTTVDLYFELPNTGALLRPGEKVEVTLPARGRAAALRVPRSAILHDIHGGQWVYEATAPQTYVRRRVLVRHTIGNAAVLASGLQPGIKVVAEGAAELFSIEFGTR